jgi:hypothetical protein
LAGNQFIAIINKGLTRFSTSDGKTCIDGFPLCRQPRDKSGEDRLSSGSAGE